MSYPCKYRARALLASLPYRIKDRTEEDLWRQYTAKCLRLTAENTAKFVQGNYIETDYADLIHPKPVDNRSADDVISSIKAKLKKMGGESNESI